MYWLCFLSGISSLILTELLRRYAIQRRLIDLPNKRGSHTTPTPRGGGGAIAISFLGSLVIVYLLFPQHSSQLLGIGGAGTMVALVGLKDDYGHVPARWRLVVHFIAAFWLLYWFDGAPPLQIFGTEYNLGLFGGIFASICIVWLLNLFNFMDGIDGIASIEAITVCIGAASIYGLNQHDALGVLLPLILAASVAGFLVWNFPPARIFMGDVGSGFIGIIIGAVSVYMAWVEPQLLWCWLILLGVFVVDATLTLARRIIRGDKFYEAHRSHAYQYASRKFGSHKIISLSVGVINIIWLFPIALLVASSRVDGVIGLLVAYAPLILLAYVFKAGECSK